MIDPLDGTTNYLYATLAGRCRSPPRTTPSVAAVVVDPIHRTARPAGAAGRDATASSISCSTLDDVSTAPRGHGFGYAAERQRPGEGAGRAAPHPRHPAHGRRAGRSLPVAGRADAYYERGLAWWDLAAGGLVAAEAGALVSAIDGGPAGPTPARSWPPDPASSVRCVTSSALWAPTGS